MHSSLKTIVAGSLLMTSTILCAHVGVPVGETSLNPDGSTTITEPRVLRGKKSLPIQDGDHVGACTLYGFNFHVDHDLSQEVAPEVISLEDDGTFDDTYIEYQYLTSLSCINNIKDFSKTTTATEVIDNPDSSKTIVEPRVLFGRKTLPLIDYNGICKRFGLKEAIDYIVEDLEAEVEALELDSSDGSVADLYKNSTEQLKEVTCL